MEKSQNLLTFSNSLHLGTITYHVSYWVLCCWQKRCTWNIDVCARVCKRESQAMTSYPFTSPCGTLPNMAVSWGSLGVCVCVRSSVLTECWELHTELTWTHTPPGSNLTNRWMGRRASWILKITSPQMVSRSREGAARRVATRLSQRETASLSSLKPNAFSHHTLRWCGMCINPKMCV